MDPMIWVIDDDASIRFVFSKTLSVNNITHRLFENAETALEALEKETPDVVVSDIKMPGMNGIELIDKFHKIDANIPFIIMTAHSDLSSAIDAFDEGSFEYLPKPFDIEQAIAVIRRAAVHRVNMSQLQTKRNEPNGANIEKEIEDDNDIIGKAPAMQDVFKFVGRVSKTDLPVLIIGECGTGRCKVAKALHNHGDRKNNSFTILNTSSIPQDMIQYELFGDANSNKPSLIEQAQNGTIFISEINEMPMDCQNRLLMLLKSGLYAKIGSQDMLRANVRVIVSTSVNLEEKISLGLFNSELYYKLSVINITIPPLRERNNDIPLLTKYFLNQIARESHCEPKKLTSEVLVFLCRLPWPGNVRQLKNLCKYLSIMVTGRDIQLVDLPQDILHAKNIQNKNTNALSDGEKENVTWQSLLRTWVDNKLKQGEKDILSEAVPEFEKIMLEATLTFTGNHKQESARLLGWGRNTLTRKIKDLNLTKF